MKSTDLKQWRITYKYGSNSNDVIDLRGFFCDSTDSANRYFMHRLKKHYPVYWNKFDPSNLNIIEVNT